MLDAARNGRLAALAIAVALPGTGEVASGGRRLLYSKAPSPALRSLARAVQDPRAPRVPEERLGHDARYFARILARQRVLDAGGRLQADAALGRNPFVFLTRPEALSGRTLLQIYQDIGYEAEDILRSQGGRAMVVVLFGYARPAATSPVAKTIPERGWEQSVYVPTWENVFPLFRQLARRAAIGSVQPAPTTDGLPLASERERAFILGFPEEGEHRIRRTSYGALQATGGADWEFRRLLEQKLGLFEHFRGNGRTWNEVQDPQGIGPGLPEFLGPNVKIRQLPEVMILDLGKLEISSTFPWRAACSPELVLRLDQPRLSALPASEAAIFSIQRPWWARRLKTDVPICRSLHHASHPHPFGRGLSRRL